MHTLSHGPAQHAIRYSSCIISGIRYRVKTRDENKKTQCSGVVLNAETLSFSSVRDINPRVGSVSYYGVLTDIIEVLYGQCTRYLLFKCDWVDPDRGVKEDEYKYKLVNFKHLMYNKNLPSDEPFILANQAQQVWYIPDPIDSDWSVVVPMVRRDNYDVYSTIDVESNSRIQLDDGTTSRDVGDFWLREGMDGIVVDDTVTGNENMEEQCNSESEDDFEM